MIRSLTRSSPRSAEELALSTWCHTEFVDLMACSKVRFGDWEMLVIHILYSMVGYTYIDIYGWLYIYKRIYIYIRMAMIYIYILYSTHTSTSINILCIYIYMYMYIYSHMYMLLRSTLRSWAPRVCDASLAMAENAVENLIVDGKILGQNMVSCRFAHQVCWESNHL